MLLDLDDDEDDLPEPEEMFGIPVNRQASTTATPFSSSSQRRDSTPLARVTASPEPSQTSQPKSTTRRKPFRPPKPSSSADTEPKVPKRRGVPDIAGLSELFAEQRQALEIREKYRLERYEIRAREKKEEALEARRLRVEEKLEERRERRELAERQQEALRDTLRMVLEFKSTAMMPPQAS